MERRGIGSSLKSEFGSGAVGVSCQKYTNSAVFSATLVFERRFSKKCFFFLELHAMSRSLRTRSVRAIAV